MGAITWKGLFGEMALRMVVAEALELVAFALLAIAEGFDLLTIVLLLLAGIAYGVVVYLVARPDWRGTPEEILQRVHLRIIGMGVTAIAVLTALSYLLPYRPLNIFTIFIILDVLVELLPGRVTFAGSELWRWSKLLYILVLLFGLGFLVINFFRVPAMEVVGFLSFITGNLFMILFALVLLFAFLKFAGIELRPQKRGSAPSAI